MSRVHWTKNLIRGFLMVWKHHILSFKYHEWFKGLFKARRNGIKLSGALLIRLHIKSSVILQEFSFKETLNSFVVLKRQYCGILRIKAIETYACPFFLISRVPRAYKYQTGRKPSHRKIQHMCMYSQVSNKRARSFINFQHFAPSVWSYSPPLVY